MTPTQIDPRQLAETFQMDTYELAEQLASWAYTALPGNLFNSEDVFGPMPLEDFDAAVEKARRYLVDSHESMKAWSADNPTPEDADA
jgi:hypothetical protein